MIKALEENPKLRFKAQDDTIAEVSVNGCLVVKDNEGDEGEIRIEGGCATFPPDEWELVREPVDFMTAVNSGKKFKPETWFTHIGDEDGYRDLYDNLAMFKGRQCLNLKTLNGKWYIEN
jgi:hypothetical protein